MLFFSPPAPAPNPNRTAALSHLPSTSSHTQLVRKQIWVLSFSCSSVNASADICKSLRGVFARFGFFGEGVMGSNISGIAGESEEGGLGDIPESCAALVLTHLDPLEICNLARLNRAFRGASSADFIWESKLPSNYRFIIDEVLNDFPQNLNKKHVYARLCRPNSFDGGTKELWLDKSTGGMYVSISSKGLAITGIDDRRYWNHIPTDESRYQTVAYLQQMWWFEVGGEFEFQFPPGTYSLYFRLQLGRAYKRLGRRVCNPEHIHGWEIKPVHFQLSTSDGQHAVTQCYLDNPGSWVHYHVGDFVVERPNALTKIKFSVTQIDCTHTKGGLCVDSVLIWPKRVGKELKPIL
ncbi:F-box protein PP2-A13-like [Malania oleifera]|uniref:F-box protein PP2-A13-like n=1 Tax=Malania oleifera TaxID=397392 RepID=UPI0025AEABCE|nr:F-box protein PP2-A13-like [Malania oleifera]